MNFDRRRISDRRTSPTPPLSKYIFKGRRRKARRREEDRNYYVDRYEFRYLLLITAILILCFLDAYFTLTLIRFGGLELNPFMLLLMNKDIALALISKYLITVFCLILFLLHKNFRIFKQIRINSLIYGVLWVYLALVSVEIYWILSLRRVMLASP
jgi:hypothetical protein